MFNALVFLFTIGCFYNRDDQLPTIYCLLHFTGRNCIYFEDNPLQRDKTLLTEHSNSTNLFGYFYQKSEENDAKFNILLIISLCFNYSMSNWSFNAFYKDSKWYSPIWLFFVLTVVMVTLVLWFVGGVVVFVCWLPVDITLPSGIYMVVTWIIYHSLWSSE